MTTNSMPRSVPERNENKCLCESLHVKVHGTIVYNSQDMSLSAGERINNVCHIYTTEYSVTMHRPI